MKGGRKFTNKKKFKASSIKKFRSNATKKNKIGRGSFFKIDSAKDIPKFEDMLKKSPVTIIMVHLDWCGHCKRAKPGFMEVAKQNHPGVNFAMLNGDIQGQTSIKNIKVEGVPEFIVHANANGRSTSSVVPISYEKPDIEKLAVASVNAVNQMSALPKVMAIDVLNNIKKNKSAPITNSMPPSVTMTPVTMTPVTMTPVTMSESALPVPNVIAADEEEKELPKDLQLPEEIPTMPVTTKSMNFMSATSPMATLMNLTKKPEEKKMQNGGQAPSIVNMVSSVTHPTQFVAKVKGTTLRGSVKSIMKAIKKMK